MKKEQVNVSHFFQVSEVLFYLTNLFVFIGLVIYTVKDVTNYFIPLGIADISVLVLQIVLLILVFAGKLNRNSAMAILMILAIFVFQLTAFVVSSAGGNVALQISITTFISLLFASLAAFTVSKYMALAVGGINLLFFISITLIYQEQRMMEDLVFFSVIIVGYSIAMYYYRHSLESLAEGLYGAYQTVKRQKFELEVLKEKADQINEANRPFVVFGRNTSGLVHDFKNDIGLLDSSRQILRMKLSSGREVGLEDIEDLERQILRLSERVETVKFVVSASSFREAEQIPVAKLINAAVYPFRLTLDLKNRILFDEAVEGDPAIEAPRHRLVQILENLIRNACEAIVDHQAILSEASDEDAGADADPDLSASGDAPGAVLADSVDRLMEEQARLGRVRVEGRMIDKAVFLAVEDNGPGMGFCAACEGENCLECAEFEIGKTTKPYGSGIGMVSVIEAVQQLRGTMRILSRLGRGTRVEILLPGNELVRLSEDLVRALGFPQPEN
jgi:signal transduction histidine kinase